MPQIFDKISKGGIPLPFVFLFSKKGVRVLDKKQAAVSLRNVTKTFGKVTANSKVNLDIYKGEILALLGENGS